ncbi:putative secreted protein [Ixodes scapularis]
MLSRAGLRLKARALHTFASSRLMRQRCTMAFLPKLVFLALAVNFAYAEPSCTDTRGFRFRRYVCKDFRRPEDFQKYVVRGDAQQETWFQLRDSHLEHLPSRAFAELNMVKLTLHNVTVTTFAESGPDTNPFSGVEDTLRKVVFHDESTLPASWVLLSGLKKLEEVCVDEYKHLNLTRDFNHLPQGVKTLYVTKSTVHHVDPDWVSSLTNLEALVFKRTTLKTFARSWLPRPAPRFTLLDLPDNHLTTFPEGLGDELPRLSVVNVERNHLTTLEERDLGPLQRNQVFVSLTGNPMHCDCKLWFLFGYTHRWHYFKCSTPEALHDRYFMRLTEEGSPCTNATSV